MQCGLMIVFYECECGGHGIRYKRECECGETLSGTRINAHLFSFNTLITNSHLAVAGLAPGVKKLRGGARERSLSFIFVLIEYYCRVCRWCAVVKRWSVRVLRVVVARGSVAACGVCDGGNVRVEGPACGMS